MIKVTTWNAEGGSSGGLDGAQFDPDSVANHRLVWIDLVGDDVDEHRDFLMRQIGLDKLAVDEVRPLTSTTTVHSLTRIPPARLSASHSQQWCSTCSIIKPIIGVR